MLLIAFHSLPDALPVNQRCLFWVSVSWRFHCILYNYSLVTDSNDDKENEKPELVVPDSASSSEEETSEVHMFFCKALQYTLVNWNPG